MTVKQFLKSKAFQAILVLLCIALVSGGLLSILNDVLYISPNEKTQRAIKKVYGSTMDFEDMSESLDEQAVNKYGSVESLYLLSDGNYLIQVVGINGYKQGTVTLWLVAEFDNNNFLGLKKVVLESYEKQTLMSQFGSKFYEVYAENDEFVIEGGYFSTGASSVEMQNLSSGATYSSNAINNAVNCGLAYIRALLIGGYSE